MGKLQRVLCLMVAVVMSLVLAIRVDADESFNVKFEGGNTYTFHGPITLNEMIETIAEVLNVKPKIKELPMQPGDVDRTYADIEKAKKLIGYEPKTTFKEGIKKFIEWYKENQY